jgi:uncharacterized protein YqeY
VTLKERLQSETTAAMRSGDALRRDVLRMASNALYLVEKKERRPLSDDEELQILSREVKTRRESIEAFQRGRREDLASKEAAEIAILSEFLPASLTDAELHAIVGEAIVATGASSARDLGKVMGWLAPRTRGRADGKRLSELVGQSLARLDLSTHDTGGGH